MIKYPSGQIYTKKIINGKAKNPKASFSSANRGMSLENDINLSNEYYCENNIAVITKRPTPINVVKVDYTKGARIVDAYFEKQSTTDYNGVYKGKYLDFEVKNTISKTSFPLTNIHDHQISHLKRVIKHGGIAFFIIEFSSFQKYFFLDAQYVIGYYEHGDRKSISLKDIEENGIEIPLSFVPRLDYLKIVDSFYKI